MENTREIIAQNFNFDHIPVIDISPFVSSNPSPALKKQTTQAIRSACITSGFFYIKNHGVSPQLRQNLIAQARQFFDLPKQEKFRFHMSKGGSSLGYYDQQFTNGERDIKEGIYVADGISPNPPEQLKGTPYYGPNIIPDKPPQFKETILKWISALREVGAAVVRAISASLYLPESYFSEEVCKQTFNMLGINHYPVPSPDEKLWGIGQHTDYGLVTILLVTEKGLEVKTRKDQWVKADPTSDTFIVNLGDMLERITKGLYRSTPHRVRNQEGKSRYAFPFFYEPNYNILIKEIDVKVSEKEKVLLDQAQLYERWDKKNMREMTGTYGSYLLGKISFTLPGALKTNMTI